MHKIQLTQAAKRDLDRRSGALLKRIITHISALAENPRPNGCIKIKGSEKVCRIRVGDYRVVYEINDKEKIVWITIVDNRKDVYR